MNADSTEAICSANPGGALCPAMDAFRLTLSLIKPKLKKYIDFKFDFDP